ncbi:EEF1A lysine methyltransferase 3 [Coccomyxa sp. Obi]|nr:EEF1A lysine methyltransferase 3 [Coccomyxa sp. Obi]
MALVPFRVSGAAADQSLEHRLFQIGGHTIKVRQNPVGSGAHQHIGVQSDSASEGAQGGCAGSSEENLENVGLVVWQSAFVLAEFLMAHPPFGAWHDVSAVDLGTGTGVVGLVLALAGADVTLTDLLHVTWLARENVAANCDSPLVRAQVRDYAWGEDVASLPACPDLITGADIVYQSEHFPALLHTLEHLAAPHTLIYLSFRLRGRGEESFEQMLAEKDFAVLRVPVEMLHEEYRDGQYRVLRICKRGG